MNILFIHPRKGLFQLTRCQDCGHKFMCENCDANLTTYRVFETNMQLICNQCQSCYNYPVTCPKCLSKEVNSMFGGIDDLIETIEKEYKEKVTKIDSKTKDIFSFVENTNENQDKKNIFATTRVFDPSLDYTIFDKIVIIKAENLCASPDYLVSEDTHHNLAGLFLSVGENTEIILDTEDPESDFFVKLARLNEQHLDKQGILEWFLEFVKEEKSNREKFGFPPFMNLILLTTQQKTKEKSIQNITTAKQYLMSQKSGLPNIKIGSPYQAKFFRRKGMFSHHLLVKYPRQYEHYFELQSIIKHTASCYSLQVRLNPRHLF